MKLYSLIGKIFSGVAGAIVGFLMSGIIASIIGALIGIAVSYFLEKVLSPTLKIKS